MFIIWQRRKLESFTVTGLLNLLANRDELNLNLPKFARPLYFCFLGGRNIFVFLFATFSTPNETGLDTDLDAGLDGKI